jgi:RNA polymerase sigma-70 factor (ECF subfamily)
MTLVNVSEADALLVVEAKRGNRDAFGDLVEQHWTRLVRLARSVVGDMEAEDVVQEGFVIAWRKLSSLSEPASFGAWVGRIVLRRCLRRARSFRRWVGLDDGPEPSCTDNHDDSITVWQLLRRLAPRQRAVLHLTAVEGLTDSEIGQLLGIAAASVRAHRRRARTAIGRLIAGGQT